MGYDCTLHAVDEKLIGKDFVKALLGGTVPTKGPVADAKLDEGFWKSVFEGFEKEKPSGAASLVCQLALVFASKSLPYHYERGFAVSLWPELSEGLAAKFPDELTESPEVLFKDLVKARPELKGSFPNDFNGNWSTGRFIPAKKVPKALAWVEKQVQKYDEGDRDLFRGLILVLKHCLKHKLAYWEATDLPVPMATIEPEGGGVRRTERFFSWPDHGYEPLASKNDIFVCACRLGPGPKSRTGLVDFASWPPRIQWLQEYAINAAFSIDGKVLTVSRDTTIDRVPNQVRIRDYQSGAADPIALKVSKKETLPPSGIYNACFVGDQIMALHWFEKDISVGRHPLIHNCGELVECREFRPTKDMNEHFGGEKIAFGSAQTGSGEPVFIWGEKGYVRENAKWKAAFQLRNDPYYDPWASVPAGSSGFYFLSNRQLFESSGPLEPTIHLARLTNIMRLRAGPAGSLLLQEGDNKAGDWGKLYWPGDGLITSLKPTLLPDIGRRDLRELYWLESKQRLLAFADNGVWFLPWDELKSLPKEKLRQ